MGGGQMLITIGAIVLLGSIILTTNRTINGSSNILLYSNIGLESVSLATSTIEEAESKSFDESTINQNDTALTQLTQPSMLGQESGDMDDFDDWNGPNHNGLVQTFNLSTGIYKDSTRVCYVNVGNLQGTSTVRTWHKRIDVWVWNTVDPVDKVYMSAVYSYWYFR